MLTNCYPKKLITIIFEWSAQDELDSLSLARMQLVCVPYELNY